MSDESRAMASIASELRERNKIERLKAAAMEKQAMALAALTGSIETIGRGLQEINATFEMVGGILSDFVDQADSQPADDPSTRSATLGEEQIEPMGPTDV